MELPESQNSGGLDSGDEAVVAFDDDDVVSQEDDMGFYAGSSDELEGDGMEGSGEENMDVVIGVGHPQVFIEWLCGCCFLQLLAGWRGVPF